MRGKHAATKSKNHKKRTVIFFVEIIFIILLIFSIIKISEWIQNNQKNKTIIQEISDAITIEETKKENDSLKYKVNFSSLKEKNKDTVAWLKVENSNIEYPIVKTKDNDYYLTHNYYKEYNIAGWPFADYKNKFDGTDKNLIIYGHNMQDNSMFGSLKDVIKPKWYNNEENKYITLITEKENSIYEIFSVYQIEREDYYIKTDFNKIEFKEFIKTLKKRSLKDFKTEVNEDSNILTLSTCANNDKYRVVLHAVKIK